MASLFERFLESRTINTTHTCYTVVHIQMGRRLGCTNSTMYNLRGLWNTVQYYVSAFMYCSLHIWLNLYVSQSSEALAQNYFHLMSFQQTLYASGAARTHLPHSFVEVIQKRKP